MDWEQDWDNAGEVASNEGYEDKPDGDYFARLDKAYFDEVEVAGEPTSIFRWSFIITNGEYAGEEIRKTSWLNRAEGVRYFKKDLLTVGLPVNDMKASEIEVNLGSILDAVVRLRVVTNKDGYRNVWINGVVLDNQAAHEAGPSADLGADSKQSERTRRPLRSQERKAPSKEPF